MTINIGEAVFGRSALFCRIAAAMVLLATGGALLATGGCTSSNMEGATPAAAGVEGPKDTGSYPNLNIKPQVAAQQLTDDERNTKLAQLKADQQAQLSKGGGAAATNPAALTSLAKTHGDETLKQIEGKCDPNLDPTCK
jgi:hypothetical protein